MKLTHENLGIWINTYNRPVELNANIKSLRESIGDAYKINVISNHTHKGPLFDEDYGNIEVYWNTLRPDESWGYLSRNWNQCIYMGLAEYEYILVSQDDMLFKPGWLELINNARPYEFYSAPVGDLAHMTSRTAFLKVGWWDERFVGIDYQDYDYLNRAYHKMKEASSVVDNGLGWYWNDIGLANYWIGKGFKDNGDRPRGAEKIHNRLNRKWYAVKRGMRNEIVDNPMCHKDKKWRDINQFPCVGELDWYPWFTSKMQKLTGNKQQFAGVPYRGHYGHDGY